MKGWFFTTMLIDQLVNPDKDGYFFRMSNRYWLITDKQEVLFFGTSRSPFNSPQCNINDGIINRLREAPKKQGINVIGSKLIPIAFQPIRIADFQD